jgi:hypothetical protein
VCGARLAETDDDEIKNIRICFILYNFCIINSAYPSIIVKVRVSYPITLLDRPLGFQRVEAPRASRHSAHEGGPKHRPPLPPDDIPITHLLGAESTPGPY